MQILPCYSSPLSPSDPPGLRAGIPRDSHSLLSLPTTGYEYLPATKVAQDTGTKGGLSLVRSCSCIVSLLRSLLLGPILSVKPLPCASSSALVHVDPEWSWQSCRGHVCPPRSCSSCSPRGHARSHSRSCSLCLFFVGISHCCLFFLRSCKVEGSGSCQKGETL